jgi:short subunit dehydrogenase-like uncharacterized protein
MVATMPAHPAPPEDRAFDLVLFGATGFTGRLVAEVLQARHASDGVGPAGSGRTGPLRWALAGRSAARLQAVRDALAALPGAGPPPALRVADAADTAALRALAGSTRAVLTTAGPYSRHGEGLARACAEAGTDYLDLCGEPLWMARMVRALQAPAQASGARIVFSCGFDSVPFDLGVVFLQQAAQQRFGVPLAEVHAGVRAMKGRFSGGTAASLLATLEEVDREPALAATLADPFALTPGFRGPPQPDDAGATLDTFTGRWTAPFVMAPINTKNVHRTHALRGHPWGAGFVYVERSDTGPGARGLARARALARQARWQQRLLDFTPTRALIRRFVLPAPGQGPGPAEREAGGYEIGLAGRTADGRELRATVRGERDPGYGSTSRIVAEAARCLLHDTDRTATPGGVWTPGAAMGLALVRGLQAHAGLHFSIDG